MANFIMRTFLFILIIYLVLIEIPQPARSQEREGDEGRGGGGEENPRSKKASLVKKLMKKKPKDGNIRLVDGTNEHEGR